MSNCGCTYACATCMRCQCRCEADRKRRELKALLQRQHQALRFPKHPKEKL